MTKTINNNNALHRGVAHWMWCCQRMKMFSDSPLREGRKDFFKSFLRKKKRLLFVDNARFSIHVILPISLHPPSMRKYVEQIPAGAKFHSTNN